MLTTCAEIKNLYNNLYLSPVDGHWSLPPDWTFLHIVAHFGLAFAVNAAPDHVKDGTDFWCPGAGNCSPLCLAARRGHAAVVKAILDRGLKQTGIGDRTDHNALHSAVECAQDATASLPIAHRGGIDLNGKDSRGQTPPHHPGLKGRESIARTLLGLDAQATGCNDVSSTSRPQTQEWKKLRINAKDKSGRSPLFDALTRGQWSIAKLLKQEGGDMDLRDDRRCSALGLKLLQGRVSDGEIIITSNVNSIRVKWTGQKPIYYTPSWKDLLKQNVRIDHVDKHGRSALFTATKHRQWDVVKRLLELGADPQLGQYGNKYKTDQWPLIRRAFDNADITKLLIEHGAEVNFEDPSRPIALHCVCKGSKSAELIRVAQVLMDAGANVKARDEKGQNVFFYLLARWCFSAGDESIWLATVLEGTKFFLRAGASVDIENAKGKTPLDVALSLDFTESPQLSELLELLSYDNQSIASSGYASEE